MICRRCGLAKPIEAFRVVTGKSYRRTDCRECERAISLAHARAHVEERRAYSRAYARDHPEVRAAALRRRIEANGRPILTDAQKVRRRENERRRRRAASPEARHARYEKWRDYFQARYARLHGATVVDLVSFAVIAERDGWRCYMCGVALAPGRNTTFDHVVPLARGGQHTEENVRLACRSCNAKKKSRLLEEIT